VIDKLDAESAGEAASDYARHEVRISTDPMNPAAALNVVGEIASRLP
jgi:hypothetical protein